MQSDYLLRLPDVTCQCVLRKLQSKVACKCSSHTIVPTSSHIATDTIVYLAVYRLVENFFNSLPRLTEADLTALNEAGQFLSFASILS